MTHTIQDFLKYELSEMHKNVDRIEHGLKGEKPDDPRLSGQYTLLGLQKQHLEFIEELAQKVTSYDEAMEICREQMLQNEHAHMQISLTENHQTGQHSSEWWYTLHEIQFYSDMLNRVKSWYKSYA